MRPERFDTIEGLRGILCLYVCFSHGLGHLLPVGGTLRQISDFGGATMPIFFAISAFLLYGGLEHRSAVEPDWKKRFYVRRLLRIFPLWWGLLLVNQLAGPSLEPVVLVANLTFTFGFLSYQERFLPIPPAWSLFVEEAFYVFLPWLFPMARKTVNAVALLGVAIAISATWKLKGGDWGVPTANEFILHGVPAYLPMFFIGILMRQAWDRTRFMAKLEARLRSKLGVTWLDALAFVIFFAPLIFGTYMPSEISTPLVLLAALSNKTALARACHNPVMRWAGKRCYAIYISQRFLSVWPARFLVTWIPELHDARGPTSLAYELIVVALVMVFAALSWRFFERPLLAWNETPIPTRSSPLPNT